MSLRRIAGQRYFGRMKTRITLTLLLLATALTPLSAQDFQPDVTQFTLGNGLTVALQKDSTLPLVSLNCAYRAGSSRDPKGKTGTANIAGEILLTGTRDVPREELLRLRDDRGVAIQGRTSVDWMNISSVYPADLLERAIEIEADRMQHAETSISVEIFEAMIAALRREHQRRLQQPLGTLMQQIYDELYVANHPYRHSTIGMNAHLDSLTLEDVRGFMLRYYTPANASLTLSGHFDPATVPPLLDKHFAGIPAGVVSRWRDLSEDFTPVGQSAFVREDRMEFNQLHLVFPTVRIGHPDAAALHVLAKALNGSPHAILQKGMVEANPAVMRVEAYQSSQELDGHFWISITVKPDARLQPLYGQIMQLLASIAADGATEEEVIGARNQAAMEFYTPQEAFYGFGGRGDVINLGMLYGGDPLFSYRQFDLQQMVTSTDIQRVTARYLNNRNQLVVSAVPMGKREYAAEP